MLGFHLGRSLQKYEGPFESGGVEVKTKWKREKTSCLNLSIKANFSCFLVSERERAICCFQATSNFY